MTYRETTVRTDDGLSLFARVWLPDEQSDAAKRASVAFVHGFTDHGGRHDRLVRPLVARGFSVHALDLRGHGRSDGVPAWVERFDRYVDDFRRFLAHVCEEHRPARLFAIGFSAGGTVVARWAASLEPRETAEGQPSRDTMAADAHRCDVAGVVLIAPAIGVDPNIFPLLRRLAPVASRFLPRVRLVRLGCENISRDPAVVEAFRRDPLVRHGRFPIRTGAEILHAGADALAMARRVTRPLLVLQGGEDRVVDPQAAGRFVTEAGSVDKTMKLYPGLFHELHSEPEREQVIGDLLAWLDAHA